MIAKTLEIETCCGLVSLSSVMYDPNTIYNSKSGLVLLHVSLSILDPDYTKLQAIRKTQLITGRLFRISETEKGINLVFTYPIQLIKSATFK